MSTNAFLNPMLPSPMRGARGLVDPRAKTVRKDGLSLTGAMLIPICLLVVLSAFERFRLSVGGLLLHPYLVALIPLFLIVVLTQRVAAFPTVPLALITIFGVMFAYSTGGGKGALGECVKLLSGVATVVTVAVAVRSRRDFRLAAVALTIAVTLMSLRALTGGMSTSQQGANPLDTANENAFSLYTVPPLLLAGWIAMDKRTWKLIRLLLVGSMLIIVVSMFSNANRSGWLCAALVPVLLVVMKRGEKNQARTVLFVAALFGAGALAIVQFADLKLVKYRFAHGMSSKSTDGLRIKLAEACASLGLENPICGVGPGNLGEELGRAVGVGRKIDPHNVFGYVIGGSGLIAFTTLLAFGVVLYRAPIGLHRTSRAGPINSDHVAAHNLLKMMLILWFIRGNFSREIIYSPGFCIGLGLAIGICIADDLYRPRPQNDAVLPQLTA